MELRFVGRRKLGGPALAGFVVCFYVLIGSAVVLALATLPSVVDLLVVP
jgi:hypothetical protein